MSYRLAEAASGQGPTLLLDDATNPVHLTLSYDGKNPFFDLGSGGDRHLRFDGASNAGGLAAIANTKLAALHLSRAATIEVKFRLDDCAKETDQQRVIGLGDGDYSNSAWFALRAWKEEFGVAITWGDSAPNGQLSAIFYGSLNCPAGVLVVQHWVVDTEQPVPGDRVRAYQHGARLTLRMIAFNGGTARYPTKGERISLGSGVQKIYLGRAHAGVRAAKSRIYFAAIYDRALTEPEIALRVAELRADD